jgi:hypothetical protein
MTLPITPLDKFDAKQGKFSRQHKAAESRPLDGTPPPWLEENGEYM